MVRMVKSRRLRRARYVTRIKEGRSAFKILISTHTRNRLSGVDGIIIIE